MSFKHQWSGGPWSARLQHACVFTETLNTARSQQFAGALAGYSCDLEFLCDGHRQKGPWRVLPAHKAECSLGDRRWKHSVIFHFKEVEVREG